MAFIEAKIPDEGAEESKQHDELQTWNTRAHTFET
jgi:hypothetical protein